MVVIAHRLSTIANSDEILVMKEGKIIEQGNHQDYFQRILSINLCGKNKVFLCYM